MRFEPPRRVFDAIARAYPKSLRFCAPRWEMYAKCKKIGAFRIHGAMHQSIALRGSLPRAPWGFESFWGPIWISNVAGGTERCSLARARACVRVFTGPNLLPSFSSSFSLPAFRSPNIAPRCRFDGMVVALPRSVAPISDGIKDSDRSIDSRACQYRAQIARTGGDSAASAIGGENLKVSCGTVSAGALLRSRESCKRNEYINRGFCESGCILYLEFRERAELPRRVIGQALYKIKREPAC